MHHLQHSYVYRSTLVYHERHCPYLSFRYFRVSGYVYRLQHRVLPAIITRPLHCQQLA